MEKIKNSLEFDSIKFGWGVFKKNFRFLILVFVFFLILSIILNISGELIYELNSFAGFLFSLIIMIVHLIISIGILKITLNLYDNKKPELSDLYNHHHLIFRYFLTSLLYVIIVFFGLILFIIPGIIFLIKYYFAEYFVVDRGYHPLKALKKSGEITKGNKIKLIVFFFLLTIINILGLLFFVVGIIITAPVSLLATVYFYRKLLEEAEKETAGKGNEESIETSKVPA